MNSQVEIFLFLISGTNLFIQNYYYIITSTEMDKIEARIVPGLNSALRYQSNRDNL